MASNRARKMFSLCFSPGNSLSWHALPGLHFHASLISPNLPSRPSNSSPHPLAQPILDQPRKNHQILRRPQQLLAHLPPRLILILPACLQHLPLLPNTRDSPQEQRADVARHGWWERVECRGGGADGGDRAGGVEG